MLAQVEAAAARLREELAARPESEGGPTLSLEALDEMLAIAASSVSVRVRVRVRVKIRVRVRVRVRVRLA